MVKLCESYNGVVLNKLFTTIEENLLIDESNDSLNNLLKSANDLVFKKFNISPKDKSYVIVGSARLYLYPTLRETFGLHGNIGDLDIVIPDKNLWINAGLENEWNNGGIYRPQENTNIEVFNVWNPALSGKEYSTVKVRPTNIIMNNLSNIGGYNYMSLYDIIDYKTAMSRDKEKDIVSLITHYQNSNINDKSSLLKKIVQTIGMSNTKDLLENIKY